MMSENNLPKILLTLALITGLLLLSGCSEKPQQKASSTSTLSSTTTDSTTITTTTTTTSSTTTTTTTSGPTGTCNTTVSGFRAIKPMNPENIVVDTSGSLNATFKNTAGATLTIHDVRWSVNSSQKAVAESDSVAISPSDGEIVNNPSKNTVSIGAGKPFDIRANPNSEVGPPGESYDGKLYIKYELSVGGFQSSKVEDGKIFGCLK